MTPASRLQACLRRETEKRGGEYRKLQWAGRRGAPDCLLDFGFPNIVLVEVKAGADRLTALQVREIDRLRKRGWRVRVVRSEADIVETLDAERGES